MSELSHSQGRFEAAVEDYSKAVKLNPRHCRVRTPAEPTLIASTSAARCV